MSIASDLPATLLAAATTLPVGMPSVTPPSPAEGPGWLLGVMVAWAVVGLAAAGALGAFRRRGIVGPERLGATDSAWTLLGLLCGGFFALIIATALASGLLTTALRLTHAHLGDDVRMLAVECGGEALAVAVVLVLARETVAPHRTGLARLGLAPWRVPVALGGGATALFILFPLIQLSGEAVQRLFRALHRPPIQPHQVLQMMDKDHGLPLTVLAVLTAAVVAPVAEELAFRGLMQTMLARAFNRAADRLGLAVMTDDPVAPPAADAGAVRASGPVPLATASPPERSTLASPTRPAARWAAVLVTSAAFAAIHGEAAFLAPIFVLSVGLGFVYERSSNLWMTIVAHALFNGAQITLFLSHAGG